MSTEIPTTGLFSLSLEHTDSILFASTSDEKQKSSTNKTSPELVVALGPSKVDGVAEMKTTPLLKLICDTVTTPTGPTSVVYGFIDNDVFSAFSTASPLGQKIYVNCGSQHDCKVTLDFVAVVVDVIIQDKRTVCKIQVTNAMFSNVCLLYV